MPINESVASASTRKLASSVARTINNAAGNAEFVGAVVDITEQKKAQDALHAAKARFEGIVEIAEDAIISVDSSQRVVLFIRGAEKVFGYGRCGSCAPSPARR